jgi:LPS export ABC transporter permease LptG/LPS export ABC transporter permease LptF
MGILGRTIFFEIASSALLGTLLFTFVLFLQKVGKLFELLVRSSAPPATIGYLFSLVLPPTLVFSVPMSVLVGVLIGLSRMSSDGEITAMRAAGVPGRRVLYPVVTFSMLGLIVTAAASLWLTPLANRETYRIVNRLGAAQLTAEIQPRVFEEQFPNTILYVADVVSGTVVRWRRIFMADITPTEQRTSGGRDAGEGPRITVAHEAIALPDVPHNRIQLSMRDISTHEVEKDPSHYTSTEFPTGDQALDAQPPTENRPSKPFIEMDTGPLIRAARTSVEARIELHQRLALPFACILLALVGVTLGVSSRKAGKSAAVVLTVFLGFLYYMGLISLVGLARQGTLPAWVAVWTPNAVFAIAGLVLLTRLEQPGDRDLVGKVRGWYDVFYRKIRGLKLVSSVLSGGATRFRLPLLPQLIDTYILSSFLFYFILLLTSFVLITEIFTFFELLSDIIRNQIPMPRVFTYLFFLAPKLIYDSTPISVLVAVLVTFGVLTKQNEVTALKACGVSLYRMAAPVLLASSFLSLALFAFDYYYIPDANRKQDAIRAEIKGRPARTYLRPDHPWIMGQGSRIYYYKHFEPDEKVMGGVSVFELNPVTFHMVRHIWAERARWEPSLETWVFQNGWVRDLQGIKVTNFQTFSATTFTELHEPPNYFLKEVKQDKQMNFEELAGYIRELRQSGFDTVRLRVQFHKKFAVPLFALIMALISVPFAFLTGNRGAMAGVGVSLGIAIAYWSVGQLFEQVGNINQLPPTLAAWSPDAVFALAGLYLLTRMRT